MNPDSHDDWSSELSTLLLCTPPRFAFFDPPSVQLFDHDVHSEGNSAAFIEQNAFQLTQEAAQSVMEYRSIDDSVGHPIFDDIDDLHEWDLLHSSTDGAVHRDTNAPDFREVSHSFRKRYAFSGPIRHSTPKQRKHPQYNGVHENVVCLSNNAATDPINGSTLGRICMKTSVSGCHPNHLKISERQRQIQLVFLPAQKDVAEGTTKYGKVAEVIQTRDGMFKLFVERGRLIETRISVTPSIDMDQPGDHPLKIRFQPYSSLGGVRRPVVGHENAVQPGHFSQIRQLCFIQLPDSSDHHYRTDENGYLCLETVLRGDCTIHQLVFPFLNSQCPTARRTEVYVRVAVIQSDGSELCETTFQVVSCASPYRDANRFRSRHYNNDSSTSDTHTGASDMDTVERGNWATELRAHNVTRPDLDISPSSSGFVSWCSPGTTGIQEDDSMPTIDAILSEYKAGEFPLACTGHRHSEYHHQQSSSDGDDMGLSLERDAPFRRTGNMEGGSTHFLLGCKRAKYDSSDVAGHCKQAALPRREESDNNQTETNFSLISIPEADNNQDCEYIIKTKSRRVYEILLTLHEKLSETFGD